MPLSADSRNDTAERMEKCKKWLAFLLFVNRETKNQDYLFDFFFEEFTKSPKTFYMFLLFLQNEIRSAQRLKHERREMAKMYLRILLPLTERFGFFEERDVLNDLSFMLVNPKMYHLINKELLNYKKRSRRVIEDIQSRLMQTLSNAKYKCDISGRYKNVYSIYRKTLKYKTEDISSLKDIFAFRIIIHKNSIDACYRVLNMLHDRFVPVPKMFKDYITIPKINGYQSLHTGLNNIIPDLDIPAEIQIRTQVMNDFAEKGLAAHWVYTKEKKSQLLNAKEKTLMQYLTFFPYSPLDKEYTYFFTFNGDICRLQKGSTILDFAYSIHSDFGSRTVSALVNGKQKDLSYEIGEGDIIELIQGKKTVVNEQWLSITKNTSTRKKIRAFLRKHSPMLFRS